MRDMALEQKRILMFRKDGSDWRTLPGLAFGKNRRTESGVSVQGAVVGLRAAGNEVAVARRRDVLPGFGRWFRMKFGKTPFTLK